MTARAIAARAFTVALLVWAVGSVVLVAVALFAPVLERCPWERPRLAGHNALRRGVHEKRDGGWVMNAGPRFRPYGGAS